MTADEADSMTQRPLDRDLNPAIRHRYGCATCDWTGDALHKLGEHLLRTHHEPAEPGPKVAL